MGRITHVHDSTQPIPPRSDAAHRALAPRVELWVESDPSGEFARYAADLCAAWGTRADALVRIEPAERAENRERLAGVRCDDRAPFARSSRGRAIRALRDARPDWLIFIGSRAARHGLASARAAGFSNTTYVALSDDLYQDTSLWNVARVFLRQHAIVTGARDVIVPAYGTRYQYLLRDWAPEETFILLPKPFAAEELPDESARAAIRGDLGIRPGDTLVVYAGDLAARARLDWLLQGWALVEERGCPARLAIAGIGPEERALRARAGRLGLSRCSLLQPTRPLAHYAAAADIVAMTSLYEMHSRLSLWAMGAGRPLVAMEADGVRMNFSHGVEGLQSPAGDTQAFADALDTLIAQPDRRALMGAAGRRRVEQFGGAAFRARALTVLALHTKGAAA